MNRYFYFKGERDYIHSSNIFDSIIAALKYIPTNVDFSLSRMTTKRWEFVNNEIQENDQRTIIGKYKDDCSFLYVLESDSEVVERIKYDEEGLVKNFVICNESVFVSEECKEFSFVEKINAAFKILLQQSIFPQNKTSYIFVRMTIAYIPDSFTLAYKRMVAGKFYEGQIQDKGVSIGFIYFGNRRAQQ